MSSVAPEVGNMWENLCKVDENNKPKIDMLTPTSVNNLIGQNNAADKAKEVGCIKVKSEPVNQNQDEPQETFDIKNGEGDIDGSKTDIYDSGKKEIKHEKADEYQFANEQPASFHSTLDIAEKNYPPHPVGLSSTSNHVINNKPPLLTPTSFVNIPIGQNTGNAADKTKEFSCIKVKSEPVNQNQDEPQETFGIKSGENDIDDSKTNIYDSAKKEIKQEKADEYQLANEQPASFPSTLDIAEENYPPHPVGLSSTSSHVINNKPPLLTPTSVNNLIGQNNAADKAKEVGCIKVKSEPVNQNQDEPQETFGIKNREDDINDSKTNIYDSAKKEIKQEKADEYQLANEQPASFHSTLDIAEENYPPHPLGLSTTSSHVINNKPPLLTPTSFVNNLIGQNNAGKAADSTKEFGCIKVKSEPVNQNQDEPQETFGIKSGENDIDDSKTNIYDSAKKEIKQEKADEYQLANEQPASFHSTLDIAEENYPPHPVGLSSTSSHVINNKPPLLTPTSFVNNLIGQNNAGKAADKTKEFDCIKVKSEPVNQNQDEPQETFDIKNGEDDIDGSKTNIYDSAKKEIKQEKADEYQFANEQPASFHSTLDIAEKNYPPHPVGLSGTSSHVINNNPPNDVDESSDIDMEFFKHFEKFKQHIKNTGAVDLEIIRRPKTLRQIEKAEIAESRVLDSKCNSSSKTELNIGLEPRSTVNNNKPIQNCLKGSSPLHSKCTVESNNEEYTEDRSKESNEDISQGLEKLLKEFETHLENDLNASSERKYAAEPIKVETEIERTDMPDKRRTDSGYTNLNFEFESESKRRRIGSPSHSKQLYSSIDASFNRAEKECGSDQSTFKRTEGHSICNNTVLDIESIIRKNDKPIENVTPEIKQQLSYVRAKEILKAMLDVKRGNFIFTPAMCPTANSALLFYKNKHSPLAPPNAVSYYFNPSKEEILRRHSVTEELLKELCLKRTDLKKLEIKFKLPSELIKLRKLDHESIKKSGRRTTGTQTVSKYIKPTKHAATQYCDNNLLDLSKYNDQQRYAIYLCYQLIVTPPRSIQEETQQNSRMLNAVKCAISTL